jgi:hypothetical protein
MADFEIEGSFEEQWGIMKSAVRAHDKTLYGNGQPGIVDFVAQTRGQFRLIVWLLATLIAAIGVYAALEVNKQSHAGIINLPKIGESGNPVTAHRTTPPQLAGDQTDRPYQQQETR